MYLLYLYVPDNIYNPLWKSTRRWKCSW